MAMLNNQMVSPKSLKHIHHICRICSKGTGGFTSMAWNRSLAGNFLSFNGLVYGKIYRNPPYFMVKTMVSCRFCLQTKSIESFWFKLVSSGLSLFRKSRLLVISRGIRKDLLSQLLQSAQVQIFLPLWDPFLRSYQDLVKPSRFIKIHQCLFQNPAFKTNFNEYQCFSDLQFLCGLLGSRERILISQAQPSVFKDLNLTLRHSKALDSQDQGNDADQQGWNQQAPPQSGDAWVSARNMKHHETSWNTKKTHIGCTLVHGSLNFCNILALVAYTCLLTYTERNSWVWATTILFQQDLKSDLCPFRRTGISKCLRAWHGDKHFPPPMHPSSWWIPQSLDGFMANPTKKNGWFGRLHRGMVYDYFLKKSPVLIRFAVSPCWN